MVATQMAEYTRTYGTIKTSFPATELIRHSAMVISSDQLSATWRRCSLSSDFWAGYASFFVPPQATLGYMGREAAYGLFSYLLNEMFENCAKLSQGFRTKVRYDCWVLADSFIFQMSHHILPATVQPFVDLITQLLGGNREDLYLATLAQDSPTNVSDTGFGYLTLIENFGIRFGFGFVESGTDSVQLDIQAQVGRRLEENLSSIENQTDPA